MTEEDEVTINHIAADATDMNVLVVRTVKMMIGHHDQVELEAQDHRVQNLNPNLNRADDVEERKRRRRRNVSVVRMGDILERCYWV